MELEGILDKALKLGAEYADARYQRYDYELITIENRALKSYQSRSLIGIGIRVMRRKGIGYASTSDITPSGVEEALRRALKTAKAMRRRGGLAQTETVKAEQRLSVKVHPLEVSPEEKVSLTLDANRAAWISDEIRNAVTRLGASRDLRLYASTEGSNITVETTLVGLSHESVARVRGVMERVRHSESLCSGFEFLESRDWTTFAEELSQLAVEAAGSKTPLSGTYPVVVDPQVVGLLLHEAFGHASEGDLIFTGDSVLRGRLGEAVASELVNIVDEGVVDGGYYYPYDDEGVRKERTILVEGGILKGYLHDRTSAKRLGAEPTGNGRAQDFENLPIVRQTNYYLEPGDHTLEELLEDIDLGVYIRGVGARGGQVETGMGTFTFSVGPSKMIRRGELAETVRGVIISGLILETLKTVDAVGRDFEMRTSVFGGCGKMGQGVRTGMGGPHIRVRRMTVGGR
jgi:TldD protein